MRSRDAAVADRARALGSTALVAASVSLLTGCQAAVLDPRGPIGAADRTILIDSLLIMLAIVVPTIVATFAFAWWFRASNRKATYRPDWEFSARIEMVVWFVPLLVIILLGGVTWIGAHALDPGRSLAAEAEPVEVEVVSLDWKWLFIYPKQGVATLNRVVVPVGVPLRFRLTSASVLNTFFVPQLGSMIYTMNGMATTLHLQADQPGTYRGISGHFSGDGFADMHFEVEALPPAQFEAWAIAARGQGGRLDAGRYRALAAQTIGDPPTVFGSVEPGLFDAIATLRIAPGPGPEPGHGGFDRAAPAPIGKP
jgi:cytochrome o ubiquinol oxidase subunit 2